MKEVAAVLGVCTAKIYAWCNGDELAHVRLTTNAIRLSTGAIAEFMLACRNGLVRLRQRD